MANPEGLEPPQDPNITDPGARQLAESSDSEDQFTDAQSGPVSPRGESPIPKTRVERVDDRPAHGEVAGTEAHEKRLQDAQPDEIAIVPDADAGATPSAEQTPSEMNTDVPITVVEESPGNLPGPHSAEFEAKREADATPDVIVSPEGTKKADNEDMPDSTVTREDGEETSPPPDAQDPPAMQSDKPALAPPANGNQDDLDEENNDGDDFDDFEEGDEDEDFDEFEDGFQQAEPAPPMPTQLPEVPLPFPIPDFDDLTPDDIMAVTEPYLASLFPPEELSFPEFPPATSKSAAIFSTDRSASLWSQLVAPPPLAPPDWIRSRTRRLFLVSLGVPVDLDEILPASKQKKLVLPSLNIPASDSRRTSSDQRSLSRLRQEGGNTSSTSVDTQGKPSSRSKAGKKGAPAQPDLDLVSARHLCMTTGEALDGMTDDELKEHVKKLESMQGKAKDLLEYWKKRTDEKIGDREAFEGVIENLVKHARKVRK